MNIDVNSAKKADYRRVWGFFLPGHRPMTHRPVRRSLGEGGNTLSVPFSPPPVRPPALSTAFTPKSKFPAFIILTILTVSFASSWAAGTVSGQVSLGQAKPPATSPGYKPDTKKPVKPEDAPRAIVYLENASQTYPKNRITEVLRIRQEGYQFRPSLAAVQTGASVQFPNEDDEFHNVFSYSRTRRFDLGRFRKDEPSPLIDFSKPGLVKIYCEIHPHMRCQVLVLDTPWFTTSGVDGSFSLPKVPAGDYTIKAFLPSEKTIESKITVRDGQTTQVQLSQ